MGKTGLTNQFNLSHPESAVEDRKDAFLAELATQLQACDVLQLQAEPVSEIRNHPEWLAIAGSFHDGQFSMLYAVSSTGDLTRGSLGHEYDSIDEWEADLWSGLAIELGRCAVMIEQSPQLLDVAAFSLEDVRAFESHADAMAELWLERAEPFSFIHHVTEMNPTRYLSEPFTEMEISGRPLFAVLDDALDVGVFDSGTYLHLTYYSGREQALAAVPNHRQLREQFEERDLGNEFAAHTIPKTADTDSYRYFMEIHQTRGKALRMLAQAQESLSNFERALDPGGETLVIPPGFRFTLTHRVGKTGIIVNGEPIEYHPFPPEECWAEVQAGGGHQELEMANYEVGETMTIVIPPGIEDGWIAVDFLSYDD